MSPEVKVAFYRIAQEALNNVTKHSGATLATVCLRCEPTQVELNVTDNDRGFETNHEGGLTCQGKQQSPR